MKISIINKLPMLLIAGFLIAGAMSVSGCNTVAGVGADVEAAGDAVKDKANEEKSY